MYKDEVLNGIENLKIYIKEMRNNDLEYNEEQREEKHQIILAYVNELKKTIYEDITNLNKHIEELEESQISDMDTLEIGIKGLLERETEQIIIISQLQVIVGTMKLRLDKLEEKQ